MSLKLKAWKFLTASINYVPSAGFSINLGDGGLGGSENHDAIPRSRKPTVAVGIDTSNHSRIRSGFVGIHMSLFHG